MKSKPCPTGGGQAILQRSPNTLTVLEEKTRLLNPLDFDGIVSQFDSDCAQNNNTYSG